MTENQTELGEPGSWSLGCWGREVELDPDVMALKGFESWDALFRNSYKVVLFTLQEQRRGDSCPKLCLPGGLVIADIHC